MISPFFSFFFDMVLCWTDIYIIGQTDFGCCVYFLGYILGWEPVNQRWLLGEEWQFLNFYSSHRINSSNDQNNATAKLNFPRERKGLVRRYGRHGKSIGRSKSRIQTDFRVPNP